MLNNFINSSIFFGEKMLRKVDTIKDVYNCIDRKKNVAETLRYVYIYS